MVFIAHGCTLAAGLWSPLPTAVLPPNDFKLLILRLLLPCLRPVLTTPTVVLPPRLRLPHLLPPAKLVPAARTVGGNTSPFLLQLSASERSDDSGTASLLRQGWVALVFHQTPCPRPCSRRRTLVLMLYFPASPGTSPSLRATTHPPSEGSDDGVVQHPSMLHRRWTAIDAHRTLLVPRIRAWSSTGSSSARPCSNNISRRSHTSSRMRLDRVLSLECSLAPCEIGFKPSISISPPQ